MLVCKKWKTLVLSSISSLLPDYMWLNEPKLVKMFISHPEMTQLRRICLRRMPVYRNDMLEVLRTRLKSNRLLQELDIGQYFHGQALIECLPCFGFTLRKLVIYKSPRLSAAEIDTIVECAPNLTQLRFELTEIPSEALHSLCKLKYLNVLSLPKNIPPTMFTKLNSLTSLKTLASEHPDLITLVSNISNLNEILQISPKSVGLNIYAGVFPVYTYPLYHAINRGLVDIVRKAFELGANIHFNDTRSQCMKLLDELGLDVFYPAGSYEEPLGYMALRCFAHATCSIQTGQMLKSIISAALRRHPSPHDAIKSLLVGNGPDKLPVIVAPWNKDSLNILLHEMELPIDVNLATADGTTALHLANNEESVSLLLNCGANPFAEDCNGISVLSAQVQMGRNPIVRLLLDHIRKTNKIASIKPTSPIITAIVRMNNYDLFNALVSLELERNPDSLPSLLVGEPLRPLLFCSQFRNHTILPAFIQQSARKVHPRERNCYVQAIITHLMLFNAMHKTKQLTMLLTHQTGQIEEDTKITLLYDAILNRSLDPAMLILIAINEGFANNPSMIARIINYKPDLDSNGRYIPYILDNCERFCNVAKISFFHVLCALIVLGANRETLLPFKNIAVARLLRQNITSGHKEIQLREDVIRWLEDGEITDNIQRQTKLALSGHIFSCAGESCPDCKE